MNGKRVVVILFALVVAVGMLFLGWRARQGEPTIAKARTAEEQARLRLVAAEADPAAPGSVIEGVVEDAKGAGVEGAVVALGRSMRRDPNAAMGPPKPVATGATASGGRFRFEDVRPGEYAVTAFADGRGAGHQVPVLVGSADRVLVRVVLDAAVAVFSGRVTDIGGGGVGGARIVATMSAGDSAGVPVMFQTIAREDGSFRLPLRKSDYSFVAEASGYAPSRTWLSLTADLTHDFKLSPAARIAGRVVERANGNGVPSATVTLLPQGTSRWNATRRVTADDEGRFNFDDVEGGAYQVEASKGALAGVSQGVAVTIAETLNDVVVPVDPAASLSGRVLAPDGKPVADALVNLWRREPPFDPSSPRAKTAADGTFTVAPVFPGKVTVRAESDEHASGSTDLTVSNADVKGIEVRLTAAAVVEARVVDGAGQPVANALVTVDVRPEGPGRPYTWVPPRRTDADGKVIFKPVGAGQLTVSTKSDQGFARVGPEPIKAADRKAVALKLERGASIAGTVRFEDGTPARGFKVFGATMMSMMGPPPDATTADDGTYVIRGVQPGQVNVRVVRPGRPRYGNGLDRDDFKNVVLAANEEKTGVDFQVRKSGKTIEGVVIAEGKPVANALVFVERDVEGRSRVYRRRSEEPAPATDADGRFVLEDLEDGTYLVRAEHPGHAEGEQGGVAAGATGVRIEMPAAASIAGRVVTNAGAPVARAVVTAVPATQDPREQRARMGMGVFGDDVTTLRISDPSGTFELGRLKPGTYELKATSADGAAASQPITVAAGERKTGVELAIAGGLKLVGRVIDHATGQPIAMVSVRATSAGRNIEGTVQPDGRFEVAGALPGETMGLMVWAMNQFVSERIEVDVPRTGDRVDLGTIPLVRGSWEDRAKTGEDKGVGAGVTWKQGRVLVTFVAPGGPAEKAGIKMGDVLVSIDGEPLGELRGGAAQWRLQGRVGTQVTLGLEGGRTVTLTREDWKPAADKKPTVPADNKLTPARL